jgi:hypothetical protein
VTRDRTHIYMKVRGELARNQRNESTPPMRSDSLRLTRAVIQDKHRGELTREISEDGWSTAMIKVPA